MRWRRMRWRKSSNKPQAAPAIPIVDVVLSRITIRGSIVGGRQDLTEALQFFADAKVRSHYHEMKLEDINEVFSDMKAGKLNGQMVMTSF
jgi:alcohol dehydrogenase, propanol-preferring